MSALPIAVHESQPPLSVNDAFMKLVPAVQRHANVCFRHLHDVDQEEAVAEATAQAYCNFRSAARRGKTDAITPSTLATYAVLRTKSYCHVGSARESNNDVLSRRAQRLRGFQTLDLPWNDDRLDILKTSNPEVWRLNLMHDRHTLPVDQVRFRIDWSGFLARQHDRTRKAVAMLAAGHKRCEVADHLGCTPSAITQRMEKARGEWTSFQDGDDGNGLEDRAAPSPRAGLCEPGKPCL